MVMWIRGDPLALCPPGEWVHHTGIVFRTSYGEGRELVVSTADGSLVVFIKL